MEISYHYIILILVIIALAVIFSLIYGNKKSNQWKEKFLAERNKQEKLKAELKNKSKRLEIHQEELTAQTEYLKDLNTELYRLSIVASHTDNGVLIADKEGKILWINEGFSKLIGFSLSEIRQLMGEDIFLSSNKTDLKKDVEHAVKNKTKVNYISEFKTKSGKTIWLNTLINPIFDENGEVEQFVILETDISALKQANDKLKKLSLVTKKTKSAVLIYDKNEKLDYLNEGFHQLYGYTKQEFVEKYGNTFDNFCQLNQREELKKTLLEKKDSISFVKEFEDKKLQKKWKQVNITPIFDPFGILQNLIVIETDISKVKNAEKHIQKEKDKSDKLLLNILPEETAEELKSKGKATPRFYRSTSILFADIQNFTKKAENFTPKELVEVLQNYFSRFDDACVNFFVEKIKIIGDAFLCVGGIPLKNNSHPFDTVLLGLELQKIMKEIGNEQNRIDTSDWKLRVGIHTGPLVAGVVGKQKIAYDIWGDSVNIAKRIESACIVGMVNISAETYRHVKDYFVCENRGKILAKHKGHIDMYFVHRIKPKFSEDEDGLIPNKYFKEMLAKL